MKNQPNNKRAQYNMHDISILIWFLGKAAEEGWKQMEAQLKIYNTRDMFICSNTTDGCWIQFNPIIAEKKWSKYP